MRYLLVDNGSLRADSVLNLRRVAEALSERTGLEVMPASLLHSSKVDPAELDGIPAVNLEKRLRLLLESGERDFTLIPFFFGPTGAITDYLPVRIARLRERFGDFRIARTPFLHSGMDEPAGACRLSAILAANVRRTIKDRDLAHPRVALVDHGSPLPEVTQVRDQLAGQLRIELGEEINGLSPASMERRPGVEYAFNEPLLEHLLREDPWREGEVVVAMLFLSPGRHAGPGGDIDQICRNAMEAAPGLKTFMTELVGSHPLLIELLQSRLDGPRTAL